MDPLSSVFVAFIAGLLAPLGAVCVLPLYPGYLVYLANRTDGFPGRELLARFSLVILAGILLSFFTVGLIITGLLEMSLSAAIGSLSLAAFVILAIISVVLILGVDISRYLPAIQRPRFTNPYRDAFIFGLFFGLVIIPCNPAPLILLFALSTGVTGYLANGILLAAFCAGLAVPLLVVSLLPSPVQQRLMTAVTSHRRAVNAVCGVIMLVLSMYYLLFVFRVHEIVTSAATGLLQGI